MDGSGLLRNVGDIRNKLLTSFLVCSFSRLRFLEAEIRRRDKLFKLCKYTANRIQNIKAKKVKIVIYFSVYQTAIHLLADSC